jgi:transposase
MLRETDPGQVYLARGATDMRKNIDSLAAIVAGQFDLDVMSGSWFVFCGRGRDKLKILYWEGNGFWLYYRRLERGRFRWPGVGESGAIRITSRELRWILDGLSIEQSQAHRPVFATAIV